MVNSIQSHGTRLTPLIRRLRLPQLQLVRMAGSGANFRDMAAALHVTQPAITKMAQELERAMGAPVFLRGRDGVRLTAFGQAVLAHAQRALTALDQLEEDLPRYLQDAAGAAVALRVGSPSFTAAALLARPVAQWLQQAPSSRVLISDGVSAQLLAALKAGELDCVVGSIDEGSTSDTDLALLHFEPLYDDRVTFVTHPQTAGLDGLTGLAQLVALPWVMPPRSSQVWLALWPKLVTGGHPLPRGVVEATSIAAIAAILQQAPGTVGALRVDAARYLASDSRLRMLSIAPTITLPQVGIVRLRNAPPSADLEALLALVRAEVRHLLSDSQVVAA